MKIIERIKKDGISLRTVYIWMVVVAMIITGLMIYSTFRLTSTFADMSEATDEYISLDKAAYELMDASDYLTEKVQRFTLDGNMEYLNDYFTEAFITNRRENAIAQMSKNPESATALAHLKEAMEASKSLMDREYYAMKLVIEAKGYTDYPEILKNLEISREDAALDPDEKMKLAAEMVLGEEYYRQKDVIRSNMKESLHELETLTRNEERSSVSNMRAEIRVGRFIILLQGLSILFMVWLTSRLGIKPILKAVDKIKEDNPLPEMGANEFRYLARTYNKMYSVYKKSVAKLNYKASHDELTGVYNRAGYDLLLSSIDLKSTFMLLIDVDDFKSINDTYGHEEGDRVLKKVADTLTGYFRSDDYICRIGGDEFVVFMVHAGEAQSKLIESKIKQINIELANKDDDLADSSISVGIAHGSQAKDPASMFKQADKALYETKRKGKSGYTFYTV